MDNKINNNGHPYVDLDLPSGTLWATCNVGASKQSDCGLFFQWGDIKGYTKGQVGKDKQFTWDDYKFSINGSVKNFSKYTNSCDKLELKDDAAHANMGGDWHIPNPTQIKELLDNTTSKWTTLEGVKGRLFTSKKETSKSIFIPAAGEIRLGSSVCFIGFVGEIWSSMLSADSIYGAQRLSFSSKDAGLYTYLYRYYGLSVRGVIG